MRVQVASAIMRRMHSLRISRCVLFFFIDPATSEIYTLSLHDALPISAEAALRLVALLHDRDLLRVLEKIPVMRSEEHTSELQSRRDLVCRLLLEKKNTMTGGV